MTSDIRKHSSDLELMNLVFTEIEFKRNKDVLNGADTQINISAKIKTEAEEPNIQLINVSLFAKIRNKSNNDFLLDITLAGDFRISNDKEFDEIESLAKNNTVAIMFPYLRSQISLMTSQPSMEPIVLGAININSMMTEEQE